MNKTLVFYTGGYSYRKLSTWIVSLFCVGMGLFVLAGLAVSLFTQPESWPTNEPKAWLALLFFVVWISAILPVGFVLLWYCVSDRRIEIEINTDGIKQGSKTWPWRDISWLSARRYPCGMQLFFQRRGRLAIDRHLQTDLPLTEEEYASLLGVLQVEVCPHQPHLSVV